MASRLDLFIQVFVFAEDTTTGPFLDALGFRMTQICSGAFLGHAPTFGFASPGRPKERYPLCPPRYMKAWPYSRRLARLSDVVVFHQKDYSGDVLQSAIPAATRVFDSPDWLRWYSHDLYAPTLCRGQDELKTSDPYW
jgi:hypothetical protein